jgi:5-(carboxyamino)imidazole ribonucleotide synthase
MTNRAPLPPGSCIGIIGGGQLGRYLAVAAADLGFASHIFCPDPDSPAFAVSAAFTCAAYDDEAALERFAASTDVITYEFENIPAACVETLSRLGTVLPDRRALETAQDRLTEKNFLTSLDIPVAPFMPVVSLADLDRALAGIGAPAVLKTRRFGYDGKGQIFIRSASESATAWAALKEAPAILEGKIDFDFEISVIIARGRDGRQASFTPGRNHHRNHILDETTIPAGISPELENEALALAARLAEALDYTGVMGVEMFVAGNGKRLLVNEIAPRVHNSGHWTLDGTLVSQFEQHIRAIAGWPLQGTRRHSNAIMKNLIGEDAGNWRKLAAAPDTALHLYGKKESREGRKMGHITRLLPLDKPPRIC